MKKNNIKKLLIVAAIFCTTTYAKEKEQNKIFCVYADKLYSKGSFLVVNNKELTCDLDAEMLQWVEKEAITFEQKLKKLDEIIKKNNRDQKEQEEEK